MNNSICLHPVLMYALNGWSVDYGHVGGIIFKALNVSRRTVY